MRAGLGSVLYACSLNAIRSPMCEAITKHYYGHRLFVDSVGVRAGVTDPFAIAVMDEIGIDLTRHKPKTFDDLEDGSFDLVVTLSPEAQHRAVEMTRTMACEVEYWQTFDPSVVQGAREHVMDAYRGVRDRLIARIRARLDPGPAGSL